MTKSSAFAQFGASWDDISIQKLWLGYWRRDAAWLAGEKQKEKEAKVGRRV